MGLKLEKIDTIIPGLCVRQGSYFLRKMVSGFHIQRTIGRVDEISQEDAERSCIELISSVKKQGKFAVEMSDMRTKAGLTGTRSNRASTLSDIANEMIAHGKQHGTPKTGHKPWKKSTIKGWEDWCQSERMQPLLNQPVANITPQDIEDWYIVDLQKGKRTATDNAFRKLRRLSNWAEGEGLITHDFTRRMALNHRRVVPAGRDGRLDSSFGELGRFALTLAQYEPLQVKHTNDTAIHLITLGLLTGRRTKEMKSMEWDWVNFDKRLITIPGEVAVQDGDVSTFEGTKNRRDFIIPMSRIIHTMFRHRAEQKLSARFVFPGRDRTGPITDMRSTLAHLIQQSKVKRIIPHDLRRTFGDISRRCRPDEYTTAESLGHTVNTVTAMYLSGLSLPEKRSLFQDISDHVSRSMPVEGLEVGGEKYSFSGQEDLEEDNRTEIDERVFHVDGLELQMFPEKIWRQGEWVEHGGIEDALPLADLADNNRKSTTPQNTKL